MLDGMYEYADGKITCTRDVYMDYTKAVYALEVV